MVTLQHEICITCGVEYGLPIVLFQQHRKGGGFHYCPNGHQQGWSKGRSEDEIVRRERDRLKQQVAERDDAIAEKERQLVAAKEQMTRLRKRIGNGVCPCCNRTFANLARHIKTKHPEEVILNAVA